MARVKSTAVKAMSTASERRFYSRSKAFGRLGIRIFKPTLMERPHWHGHVEANFIRNGRMIYVVDGERIAVEPNQMLIFWAGVPHQLVAIEQSTEAEPELCNIYLPLDSFLLMPHIPDLQVAILTGAMVTMPQELCDSTQVKRWYVDYRANRPERLDVMKMELNALFRRLSLQPFNFLRPPWQNRVARHGLATPHVRHVVAMLRHIIEHIQEPLRNEDVTKVTGLHRNYALSLFTRTMNVSLKQFIIRMRLLRTRGLLLEQDSAIATIAAESGFGSASQFYAHFSAAYGTSPQQLRDSYLTIAQR
jgi:AraC family transcriptional regulator, melibiose operon regulatory protein